MAKTLEQNSMQRWTEEKAGQWYDRQPWLVGCNFIPSTAINQLEMWQEETFDQTTIARELDWAASIGFNTLRVYLHDLAWETNSDAFTARMDQFLVMAASRGIRPFFVFFDDCWNESPVVGRQPKPIPGVHGSGWLQSPGRKNVENPAAWPRLQRYVEKVLETFRNDERILMWDLYNEPGNRQLKEKSLPLLKKVFEWARKSNPSQPLTAGVFCEDSAFKALNEFQLAASDVITFHNYNPSSSLVAQIMELRHHHRPLICTEWLRRGHSEVRTCLPVFHAERVGCCNWGLVSGKTQTIYGWDSPAGAPEPAVWFHDLLKKDGMPFDPLEILLFRKLTGKTAKPSI